MGMVLAPSPVPPSAPAVHNSDPARFHATSAAVDISVSYEPAWRRFMRKREMRIDWRLGTSQRGDSRAGEGGYVRLDYELDGLEVHERGLRIGRNVRRTYG